MNYKSSEHLFAVIKQDFSSYDANNLIDEGSFYRDVKHVINQIGYYAYEINRAVIKVDNYKGSLPNDFTFLDSAFKCSPQATSPEIWNQQLGNVIRQDIECEDVQDCNGCSITCDNEKTINKITVRTYVKGVPTIYNFVAPILLKLGNINKTKDKCASGCPNMFCDSPYEISIDDNFIYTNFKEGFVYIVYYAFPLDENGLPMIPNDTEVEQLLEYYIKAKIFENLWLNGDDVNIEKKFSFLQQKADEKFKAALYKAKLPEFNTMIKIATRNRRRFSLFDIKPSWAYYGSRFI